MGFLHVIPTARCEGRRRLTGLKRAVGGREEERRVRVTGSTGTHWELRKSNIFCMHQIQITVRVIFLVRINGFFFTIY